LIILDSLKKLLDVFSDLGRVIVVKINFHKLLVLVLEDLICTVVLANEERLETLLVEHGEPLDKPAF